MARGKAKKPKARSKGTKRPTKRAKAKRPARKASPRPAADAGLRKRVAELEAENRRLRDEVAGLRAEPALPFSAPEEPDLDVD